MNTSKSDKIALFAECFGDTVQVATAFFECEGVITVTEYIDNRLAAMASLIKMSSDHKKGFYVYGVCVAEDMRGRGLFKKIMRSAEEKAISLGADFLCLIPASESLAKKYFEFGYNIEVKPFERDRSGDLFLDSKDFADFALPKDDEADNSGRCGLLKPMKSDVFLKDEIWRFGDHMGDI